MIARDALLACRPSDEEKATVGEKCVMFVTTYPGIIRSDLFPELRRATDEQDAERDVIHSSRSRCSCCYYHPLPSSFRLPSCTLSTWTTTMRRFPLCSSLPR